MREINLNTYEEFFLDFMEGNLSTSELTALEKFLELHAELKEEFEEISCLQLESETVSISKTSIKEIPFRNDFDHFCIAKLEGDLGSKEEESFDKFLSSREISLAQFKQYEKTKLKADLILIYPEKEKLKKRRILPYWLFTTARIAASILLLISIFTISDNNDFSGKENPLVRSSKKNIEVVDEIKLNEHTEIKVAANIEPKNTLVKKVSVNPVVKDQIVKHVTKLEYSKNNIADEEQFVKVSLPEFSAQSKLKLIANVTPVADLNIKFQQAEKVSTETSNSGLSNLGMTWTSSVPKKKNSLLYALAKKGVDKLGVIAGKNIQLEKKYDSKTEKTRLNFNSPGLGFSKTVK